jgi:ATP-dependent DNA helicase DinG
MESACEEIQKSIKARSFGGGEQSAERKRSWTELRIRQAQLVQDNVTLPIQRLREAVSDCIKASEDSDMGKELMECNRRLTELREEVILFLKQSAEEYVYWVERGGRSQKSLAINAAPIDVADFLRSRLFGANTSIIMTSATLATRVAKTRAVESASSTDSASRRHRKAAPAAVQRRMRYFAERLAQRPRRCCRWEPCSITTADETVRRRKMPDPRQEGYRDALLHWVKHSSE